MIKLSNDIIFDDPELRIREYCEIEINKEYDRRLYISNMVSKKYMEL